jgi:hypothetical protein
VVKTKLRLSERTFRCDECPLVLDRDLNAARNLAALVGEVGLLSPWAFGFGRSQSFVDDPGRAADSLVAGMDIPPSWATAAFGSSWWADRTGTTEV